MSSNKVANKIKKYKRFSSDTDDSGVASYLDGPQYKQPSSGTQYIGIEIECYGKMHRYSLQKLFFKYDLEDYVMIGNDNTIEPPDDDSTYYTYEIRLLIPQQYLTPILKKFGRVFRVARLKANESCGLHVHLDMRQRDEAESYQKLLNFHDALFAIVNKDRWNNEYCVQTTEETIAAHHNAINFAAYSEHQTIEVRMHHGCTDTSKIEKWIRLLINVIDAKSVPKISSKKDVFRWKGLSKRLRGYVSRNFKPEWFEEKEGFEY
jgi:hypothetical protein